MLMTLIQKEIMHHVLSARFVALLLMCVLLIPLNLHINYHHYLKCCACDVKKEVDK